MLASIFSCKQTAKGNETPKPIEIASISVTPSTITLKKGETGTLKAVVLPKEAPQEVKWESDDPAKVSVDEKGVITAKEVGKANIKVTSLKDAKKTATCVVTVAETIFALEKIELDPTTIALKKDDTRELTLTITPKNATNVSVNWKSSAEATVSVDDKGKITAKEVGKATITVTAKQTSEGGAEIEKTATCEVTVTATEIELKELKVEPTSITLTKDDTEKLKVIFTPEDATNRDVQWESDKPAIVSVDEKGNITAKEVGTANIKVTSKKDSTKTATCVVTVKDPVPVDRVSLNKDVLELKYEESFKLIATVEPSTASQKVIWSSSDESFATCSPDGVVTAKKKEGKITITATSKTHPSKKATCTVYVAKNKIKNISFKENSVETEKTLNMTIGDTEKFDVYVLPKYATHWMNYEVETGSILRMIDFYRRGIYLYTCKLYAGDLPSNLNEKTEKITFRSMVDPNIKAVLTINIKRPKVESITVQNKEIGLTDYTEKMVATVLPAKAIQKVTWKSENPNIVGIDSDGLLTPRKPGKATIVATTTEEGSSKKAEATVVVTTPSYGYGMDKSAIYYGGEPATLTITQTQAGSSLYYDFKVESDKESDLKIEKVEERVFKISVKNKKARSVKAKLTVSSKNFSDATRYAYVNIKTIIPDAISIEGDDKMYLNETLRFDIGTTKHDSDGPTPNKDVRWEWDNSYSTSGIGASDFEITQNGTVRLKNPSSNQIGKSFKIKAILDLDNSVVASKVITIYRNVANVPKLLEQDMTFFYIKGVFPPERTMCDAEDYGLYNINPMGKEHIVFFEKELDDKEYNKFVVSEYEAPKDIPDPYYFDKTLYEAETIEASENKKIHVIKLAAPKRHTSSQYVKFYVLPIDPKTEKPYTKGAKLDFDFRIWAKPTGIEFVDASFKINDDFTHEKYGKGFQSEMFNRKHTDTNQHFRVRVLPKHANPNLLVHKHKAEGYAGSALKDDILTKSQGIDGDGCWRFDFTVEAAKAAWRKRGNILFGLSANPAYYTGNEKIKTFIQIIRDSGL